MSDSHNFDQLRRRSFLKLAGFSFAGAVASCSRAPVEKAIPLLNQPEEIVPGRSLYYASTCAGCKAGCGILIKNRDGRPIKLEGNPDHPLSKGGLCAAGQASILGLYDRYRVKTPLAGGKPTTWQTVDHAVTEELRAIAQTGGKVRFLTGTITSPTLRATIDRFLSIYPEAKRISYDPLSRSAILDAHLQTHGTRALPHYQFERAETIVSLDADFLGTWISPVEYTAGYRVGRQLKRASDGPATMSYHVQFEPRMSLTGANADQRFAVDPDEVGLIASHIAKHVIERLHSDLAVPPLSAPPVPAAVLDHLTHRLAVSRGKSLVISGSQDVDVQLLCNLINHLLGNYGRTLDLNAASHQAEGNDDDVRQLVEELRAGEVKALFVLGANPTYDLASIPDFPALLGRVPLSVSLSNKDDETTALVKYVCPDHHHLESWGDTEAVEGIFSLSQPAIAPLGKTRATLETLALWAGLRQPAYELIRRHWQAEIFPRAEGSSSFDHFWDQALHDGHVEVKPVAGFRYSDQDAPLNRREAFNQGSIRWISRAEPARAGHFHLVLYPKVAMLDGLQADNPWLQELPDPVTKVTWDNYACLSPQAAQTLKTTNGDLLAVSAATADGTSRSVELPVFIQAGQKDSVVAIATGYGQRTTRRFADVGPKWLEGASSVGENGVVGCNAWLLAPPAGRNVQVTLKPTGKRRELACTQEHHLLSTSTLLSRPVEPPARQIDLHVLNSPKPEHQESEGAASHGHEDLWPEDHKYVAQRWAMVIDLNACTGCAGCVVACQVENNIPVVGRDEVRRKREMHWLRIDSYYSGDPQDPKPVHQPMMCQQCGHAPCESVCPVLATVHSADGLNQQVYNRCVGTRYCANNCPYKTRRFNWFDYPRQDRLQNMVLNPDVTVRTRGIMEKCSFCIQRIQEARIQAKADGMELKDGAVMTACQQSCPAGAIHFGDLNDPKSKVSRLIAEDSRRYQVLEELNVRPGVTYLARVRNGAPGASEARGLDTTRQETASHSTAAALNPQSAIVNRNAKLEWMK